MQYLCNLCMLSIQTEPKVCGRMINYRFRIEIEGMDGKRWAKAFPDIRPLSAQLSGRASQAQVYTGCAGHLVHLQAS